MNIFSGIFLWPDVLCGPASATWIQIPTGQPCVPLVQDGGLAHSRCSISLADYLLPNLILVIQSTIDLENIYWGACLPSTWPSKRGHLETHGPSVSQTSIPDGRSTNSFVDGTDVGPHPSLPFVWLFIDLRAVRNHLLYEVQTVA